MSHCLLCIPADMIICVYSTPVLLITSHLTCQECVARIQCDNGLGVEMGQKRSIYSQLWECLDMCLYAGFQQGVSVYI